MADFVGNTGKRFYNLVKKGIRKILPPKLKAPSNIKINNLNYRLEWYRMQAEQSNEFKAENEYYEEILAQGRVTKIFELFNKKFGLNEIDYKAKVDFVCYRQVVKNYEERCGILIDRDFKFMANIANFCTKKIETEKADKAFKEICQ